ncbi:MAG TPA: cation:proton antiporter [Lacunisphaera sp.]
MPHDVTLIATVAVAFVFAFVFGYGAHWLRLPPLVGYLLAGVAIGVGVNVLSLSSPFFRTNFASGLAADAGMAGQLAEIGIMLLMFGVGLHFSVRDLMAVRRIAIPGALLQIVLATAVGALLVKAFGWTWGAGLVLGLSLSVASTVVVLKALEVRNGVATVNGRITIGWLIVEDLAMVVALVLLPAFAGALGGHVPESDHGGASGSLALTLLQTFMKVGTFVLIVMFFGPRVMPWLLRQVARTGSRELFTLCVLTVAIGIAFASAKVFDVSFALGAFFAGVVLSESELSHKAAENSLPLQDAFAVLFFVSVGMLFNPAILVQEPLMVLAVVGMIVIGKSVLALGIVLAFGYPLSTGLIAAAALAQVGEFSFILAGLGISYQLLPSEGLSLILAGSLISIALNPLAFWFTDRMVARVRANPRLYQRFEEARGARLKNLQAELDRARQVQAERSQAHKRFTPEELVNRFPLFSNLTPEQRELLLLHFETREARPGDRIIRAGEKADLAYFIAQGEVEVVPQQRTEKIKLQSGAFFGEMALLSGARRSADVTALDYSKFLTLSARDFRLFLTKYPVLRDQIVAKAVERDAMNSRAPMAGGSTAPMVETGDASV